MKKEKKSKKGKAVTIILLVVFFIGLSVLLYPTLSSYWNSKTQSEAILDYEKMLSSYKPEDFTAIFEKANGYNRSLYELDFPLHEYMAIESEYWATLDVSGTGMMGYITVPKINQEMPVYHGTGDSVLSIAAGHMQGSALPIGGEGTHSVVSAHRGLPTATLFTHLDRMEIGDTFYFTILDRTFTYEVDQIRIVEPDDTSLLQAEEGKDYCTLLTCTPYGINTQRLLVRGHQIDASQKRTLYVANEAYRIDALIVTPFVALPIIFAALIYVMFKPIKKESLDE
ncbi:MAG: class C sortase [Clostridia bacterium]|nr:class C sortase [Clostridia bacterium]